MTKAELLQRQAQAIQSIPGELEEHAGLKFLRYSNAAGQPCIRAWAGHSVKPYARFFFDSPELREKWVAVQKTLADNRTLARQARKLERVEYKHTLKPGAILVSTWGYEQTNVDFFQVISTTEKTVALRKVGNRLTNDPLPSGPMSGHVVPDLEKFGEPMAPRRVTAGNYVSIDGYHARPWDGGKVFASWYA